MSLIKTSLQRFLPSLAILFLAACSAPTHGLFYSAETETSIIQTDSNLGKDGFSVKSIVAVNGVYVLESSVLYGTPVPADATVPVNSRLPLEDWTKLQMPQSGLSVFSMAVEGTTLYILCIPNTGTSSGVSVWSTQIDADGSTYDAYDGSITWTRIETGIDSDVRPNHLFSVDGELLLETIKDQGDESSLYALYQWDGAASWTPLSNLDDPQSNSVGNSVPWKGICVLDGTWYFTRRTGETWTATAVDGTLASLPLPSSWPGAANISTVYADDNDADGTADELIFLSRKGWIAGYDGTTWRKSSVTYVSSSASTLVGFSTVCRVFIQDRTTSADKSFLLLGSTGDDLYYFSDGIYWVDESSSTSTSLVLEEMQLVNGNYTSTDIQNNGVNFLYCVNDPSNRMQPLFACTSQYGLWSALCYSDTDKTDPSLVWAWE